MNEVKPVLDRAGFLLYNLYCTQTLLGRFQMILNNAPQNEAVLSNVGEIGEFRIRNSAKAFNILSSGLYANKIRAIIRELSCNAVDSHKAAGKKDVPFDVHLPNQLEPYFSIRDYGTGLDHEQVTNIYTTYFESTKTSSNEFIGALGLGSKSPFSYTDNFTVTATKNSRKRIYTAFINEHGVPSIALMMEEETSDPDGVEVRFAVNDRYDFDKFRQEAREVYTYFSLRPVIGGNNSFSFYDPTYESKDIIPGVHAYQNNKKSVAVMGNIAYPIAVPEADTSLGELRSLLNCGLEIHFDIGELDFQASREGLSYIPQTVASIKKKLVALNDVLAEKISEEANLIPNLWERAFYLSNKMHHKLWVNAVNKYFADSKIPTLSPNTYYKLSKFKIRTKNLAENFNIKVSAYIWHDGHKTMNTIKPSHEYEHNQETGKSEYFDEWGFPVAQEINFVISDIKIGAVSRVKYNYPLNRNNSGLTVYVIEPFDKSKAMLIDEFFELIYNPPKKLIIKASSLAEKPRATYKNVDILKLEVRGGSNRSNRDEMVWRNAGKIDSFDNTKTYYYIPLNGYIMQGKTNYSNGRELYEDVKCLAGLFSENIYGVRKKDINDIKNKSNWKNFEEHISAQLASRDMNKLMISVVRNQIQDSEIIELGTDFLDLISPTSPFRLMMESIGSVEPFRGYTFNLQRLLKNFAPGITIDTAVLLDKYQSQVNAVNTRYPLLSLINRHRAKKYDIAEYINLVDAKDMSK